MLIVRANNTQEKVPVLEELRIKLEELKVVIRICKEVKAFPNFNSFETSIKYHLVPSAQAAYLCREPYRKGLSLGGRAVRSSGK